MTTIVPPVRFGRLFDLFDAAGRQLYLVGGCVRDMLLGTPPKDYDFATDAPPAETRRLLRAGGYKAIAIGEEFGTIAAVMEGGTYEITTYRVRESYMKGSRHPVVVFGDDLATDLGRRDLTINAIAMDRAGNVVDPFGGKQDLDRKVLRVPGGGLEKTAEIFSDDPLRLLRVGRFLARLGFAPDPVTTEAATTAAHTILEVSRERWKSEIDRLLVSSFAPAGLRWLADTGVLFFCLPELRGLRRLGAGWSTPSIDLARVDDSPDADALEQTLDLVAAVEPEALPRWAALLHAVGLPSALRSTGAAGAVALAEVAGVEIAHRFKFSNREADALGVLLRHQDALARWSQGPATRPGARRLGLATGEWVEAVLRFGEARVEQVAARRGSAIATEARQARAEITRLLTEVRSQGPLQPELPRGLGTALSAEAGVAPGPQVGDWMDWLREAIIDERLPNAASIELYVAAVRAAASAGPQRQPARIQLEEGKNRRLRGD